MFKLSLYGEDTASLLNALKLFSKMLKCKIILTCPQKKYQLEFNLYDQGITIKYG